jgi:hypothetical protein
MDRLLNVITLFSLLLMLLVLVSVRRAHIRVEYSVSWLLAGTVLFVLSRWRSLDERLAGVLGAENAGWGLLMISGLVFLLVLYRLSLRISGLTDSNIKLTQQLAILEFRLESIERAAPEKTGLKMAE